MPTARWPQRANGVQLTSDRHAKENLQPLNSEAVPEKVAGLQADEGNYKNIPAAQKHVGPMAQDFHAAFGLNDDDEKHIAMVDEGGVALAAIQRLNQKVEELKKDLARRDVENTELRQRLEKVERLLGTATTAHHRE